MVLEDSVTKSPMRISTCDCDSAIFRICSRISSSVVVVRVGVKLAHRRDVFLRRLVVALHSHGGVEVHHLVRVRLVQHRDVVGADVGHGGGRAIAAAPAV